MEHPVSGLFEIGVVAVSPDDDLDLEAFVGVGASFRLSGTIDGTLRAWTGVVAHMEQVEAETSGLSTYYLRIVPALWRATRRKNNRIFQHLTLPEIAGVVLAEWGIEPLLELDATSFPRFEYRVQYGETDFAFLSRILEEAGVAYVFRDPDLSTGAKTEPETKLVKFLLIPLTLLFVDSVELLHNMNLKPEPLYSESDFSIVSRPMTVRRLIYLL